MKYNKFTFKKVVHTGMYRSFELDQTVIKLRKKEVGFIEEKRNRKYRISLAVKKEPTKKNSANFRWITLNKKSENENEARNFIRKFNDEIQEKYNLHLFDD
jgi:hypothetical protein